MARCHWDIEQHSPEWYAIKAGKWSASNAAKIMGGLETIGLASLIQDVAWERVFGPVKGDRFTSAAMQRGTELEPESRDCYAFEHDVTVRQCGFVEHAGIQHVGWSPDGMVTDKRAIEAKNPGHRAWMEVKRTARIPSEYRWQTKWAMWVGELDALDFVVYRPESGLIVIPASVTDDEKAQMAERVAALEKKVSEWVSIITTERIAA